MTPVAAFDVPLDGRFARRIRITDDGCWIWLGKRDGSGYAVMMSAGRGLKVHRLFWALRYGFPAPPLELDHLCRNTVCVNPSHLELVTHAENVRRGRAGALQARRTHCPQDHLFDSANTYEHQGKRHCRICKRERKAARRLRPEVLERERAAARDYQRRMRAQRATA